MQVTVLAVQTVQAVPTLTLLDMLHVQALWLWNHSAIVLGIAGGAWKLFKSLKHLPEKITSAITARMDAHEKLDNEREEHVKNALADAKELNDEKWNSLKLSVDLAVTRLDQVSAGLLRTLRGGSNAD